MEKVASITLSVIYHSFSHLVCRSGPNQSGQEAHLPEHCRCQLSSLLECISGFFFNFMTSMLASKRINLTSSRLLMSFVGMAIVGLAGCDEAATKFATGNTFSVDNYEATATVTYTWQVEYTKSSDRTQSVQRQEYASTSLVNRNGQKPDEALTGPDDRGLWWPKLPPRPTVDELEAVKTSPADQRSDPQLLKDVDYAITFDNNGQRQTLPTNASVYRTASKALANNQALELTFGPGEKAIAAAEPVTTFGQ